MERGTLFAGHTIERLLGTGGMGAVYLARHPRLPRSVAVKVLGHGISVDQKARNAFEREASVAARLEHPHIVSVYDRSGPDDPVLWLSMKYVQGGDALGLLASAPGGLSPDTALRLLHDAAAALDFAHARGVLHRDVKPANLLIERDAAGRESALLTDFGIARSLDDTVTLSGMAATFAYAAPERFQGLPVDHRADIYSLGCTLYQLLTGKPPFPRGYQAAVIAAHLSAPPPRATDLRPELPAAIDTVIATAMAKRPEDRFATCAALATAATRALENIAPDRPAAPSAAAAPAVSSGAGIAARPEQAARRRIPLVPWTLTAVLTMATVALLVVMTTTDLLRAEMPRVYSTQSVGNACELIDTAAIGEFGGSLGRPPAHSESADADPYSSHHCSIGWRYVAVTVLVRVVNDGRRPSNFYQAALEWARGSAGTLSADRRLGLGDDSYFYLRAPAYPYGATCDLGLMDDNVVVSVRLATAEESGVQEADLATACEHQGRTLWERLA
ncbi:serine/threonine-protein kinase [Nocardia sp. AG03]|uniref:serine/threonine-protein kinase n=1 Tax=Nocardia sp. AG03 TaxID=3025312 RepID=UPI0024184756|nr:serine/threonine-protein kinase [Nocardia sp. AG03]